MDCPNSHEKTSQTSDVSPLYMPVWSRGDWRGRYKIRTEPLAVCERSMKPFIPHVFLLMTIPQMSHKIATRTKPITYDHIELDQLHLHITPNGIYIICYGLMRQRSEGSLNLYKFNNRNDSFTLSDTGRPWATAICTDFLLGEERRQPSQ